MILVLQRADSAPLRSLGIPCAASASVTQFTVVPGLVKMVHSLLLHAPRSHV